MRKRLNFIVFMFNSIGGDSGDVSQWFDNPRFCGHVVKLLQFLG